MINGYPYSTILINNNEVSLEAIVESSVVGNSDFEKNTFAFIREWLSSRKEFLLYTSGSTGNPKAITITRDQMIESARLTQQALDLKKGYSALLCLDTNFIAGKMMIVRSFVTEMNLVAVEPSANPIKKISHNLNIDFAALVPYQLYNITRSTEASRLTRIKTIIIGGSPPDDETARMLSNVDCSIFATYGMTETVSHIALRKLNGKNATSFYQTLPGVSVQQDERDCLVIHAPFLSHSIVTNDIVEVLTPTTFHWRGRWDNVINSGGMKLIPEQIEKSIQHIFQNLQLPYRFFISSQPDAQLGRKIILIIESNDLPDATLKMMKDVLKKKLPKHHHPKTIVTVPLFEMTKSGKINRLAVEKLLH